MADLSITSSATHNPASGFPMQGPEQNSIRLVHKATVVNGEVLTINHFADELLIRTVDVLTSSTGAAYAGATIAKTDKDTTTITFAAAGTYTIVIKN